MKIVLSPDPVLRTSCTKIERVDNQIKKLAKDMAKTMYKAGGVGLAAPQVGKAIRLIVVDTEYDGHTKKNPLTLINPQIVDASQVMIDSEEGCLSIPGISVSVKRHQSVVVRALNLNGDEIEIEAADDLFCRCLQHEIDHTNGITLFERLDPLARLKALEAYEAALAAGAQPGSTGV